MYLVVGGSTISIDIATNDGWRERYERVKGGVSDDGTPKSRSIRPCTIGVLREVLIKII
jgi:hypothetical protein